MHEEASIRDLDRMSEIINLFLLHDKQTTKIIITLDFTSSFWSITLTRKKVEEMELVL